jgi:glycosyltransferase involved in cell wall biosynthesis
MRILHFWKTDYWGGGGGAIAMNRLHKGLRESSIDSRILCRNKTTDDPSVIKYYSSNFLRKIEYRIERITKKLGLNDIHLINSFKIRRNNAYQESDLVHTHGLHGYFNYLALPQLTKNKPTIYTLHDMWSYTGHCAYSYDCKRWKTGCGNCPYPENHPAIKKDNTHLEWKLKNWVYNHSNLIIVTLSTAKTIEAKQSMLKGYPIYHIPNGINTNVFRPLDPERCRKELRIPPKKNVIMFGAIDLKQFNKGVDLLVKALKSLPKTLKNDTILLNIGHGGDFINKAVDIQTISLGFVGDDQDLSVAYSAADLFVSPTRAESLPLVLQESMACGTPLVAFNVGGVPDIVRPGITGYLAESENYDDLKNGIVYLLEDKHLREKMAQQGREITLQEFSLELQVQRHIKMYDEAINGALK